MFLNDRERTISGFSAYKLAQWPNLVSQNNISTYVEQNLEVNEEISNHYRQI